MSSTIPAATLHGFEHKEFSGRAFNPSRRLAAWLGSGSQAAGPWVSGQLTWAKATNCLG
jgi:hypothetical protein